MSLTDSKVALITTKNTDLHGRQLKNAGDATDKQDYATLNDLQTKLAPSAYIDTTNAVNLTSGILATQRLPNPTIASLGGIKSIAKVATKFIQWIDNFGNPQLAQPAFTDISGTATVAQVPAAAKPISNQNVVTGSRALGTVYHNTNVTPLLATVSLTLTSVSTTIAEVDVYTDASSTPTTLIMKVENSVLPTLVSITSTIVIPITFVILPGNYYKLVLNSGTCSISLWTEWF